MNKEKNIDEYIKDVWGNDTKRFIINSHVEAYIHRLERENKNLQKKAELGEHYKHLYSEVKKQKDDVVEYIKKNILIGYDKVGFNKDIVAGIVVNDLLRMLGETDE